MASTSNKTLVPILRRMITVKVPEDWTNEQREEAIETIGSELDAFMERIDDINSPANIYLTISEEPIEDPIARLWKAANSDATVTALEALMREAGLIWRCECGWNNEEGRTTCGDCTAAKTPDKLEGLCPVCGERVTIRKDRTKDGRLIGSCGDAFTYEKWSG